MQRTYTDTSACKRDVFQIEIDAKEKSKFGNIKKFYRFGSWFLQ